MNTSRSSKSSAADEAHIRELTLSSADRSGSCTRAYRYRHANAPVALWARPHEPLLQPGRLIADHTPETVSAHRPARGDRSGRLTPLDENAGALQARCMASLRQARWIGAVLVAPLLALSVFASSHVALRCSFTGTIMSESACPLGAEGGSRERQIAHASIAAPRCCERVVITIGKVPATASERAPECPIPWATSVVPPFPSVVDVFAGHLHGRALRAARAPGIDAPTFLLRHSFLI